MFSSSTRRNVLGAGVLAAGSLLAARGGLAQAPMPPTPACHDGDEATPAQTAGPFFKPSSPERIDLLETGMAGQKIELVGFVLSRGCKPLAGVLIDAWQADDKGRYDNSGFRLRGHQFTDADGRYRLKTIVPATDIQRWVLATYPEDERDVLLSGWIAGADRLTRKAAAVATTYGKGKIVLFGFRPQHRGQTHATFPLVFNALWWSVSGP